MHDLTKVETFQSKVTLEQIENAVSALGELLKGLVGTPEPGQAEGMEETPQRFIKALFEQTQGYLESPGDILAKRFEETSSEMIIVGDIDFTSVCLVGSTFIETPRGRIPINKLNNGDFVYCWDEDKNSMTLTRCKNPRVTAKDQLLVRVYTDKDTVLCTAKHRFLTHNRGWVCADELRAGDSVVALNKGAVKQGKDLRVTIQDPSNREKCVHEHKLVYETLNGNLPKGALVHHLNKKGYDNRPENLTRLLRADHSRLHRLEDGPTGFALFTDEQRREMKARQVEGIRESQTEEVKKRRSQSLRRYWNSLSSEQRAERNHRVLGVEATGWREDVWCMDVPEYENFVANGMVVHNCEHHLLPFIGTAHVAYIPDGPVVGLSKIPRLVDCFARRLQIQERMSRQIADALVENLNPLGVGVILKARHQCMSCRGVRKAGAYMITSTLRGVFMDDSQVRAEFLRLT